MPAVLDLTANFDTVMGTARGRSLDEELAAIAAEQSWLLERAWEGTTEPLLATVEAYIRHADHPAVAPLLAFAAEDVAEDVWDLWAYSRGRSPLDRGLHMLMGNTWDWSPWLLRAKGDPRKPSKRQLKPVIHLLELHPATEDRPQNALPKTLCGLAADVGRQPGDAPLTIHKTDVYRGVHHGSWSAPSNETARRCRDCEQATEGMDLHIPAMSARADFFDGPEFTSSGTAALTDVVNEAWREGGRDRAVAVAHDRSRQRVLGHLADRAAADPLPVLVNLLDAKQRKPLTSVPDKELHETLAALPWAELLAPLVPDERPDDRWAERAERNQERGQVVAEVAEAVAVAAAS